MSAGDKKETCNKECLRSDIQRRLTEKDVLRYLNSTSSICNEPPLHPKGGEIYLYRGKEKFLEHDYKYDQHRWINKGNSRFGSSLKKFYFSVVDPDLKGKNSLKDFTKHVYCRISELNSCFPATFLIHYMGNEKVSGFFSHGNNKSKRKWFVASKKEVFKEIKSNYDKLSAKNLYVKLQNEKEQEDDLERMPVSKPRNVKQVKNIKH